MLNTGFPEIRTGGGTGAGRADLRRGGISCLYNVENESGAGCFYFLYIVENMHRIASFCASFFTDQIVKVLTSDILMTVKVTFLTAFLGFRASYFRSKGRK